MAKHKKKCKYGKLSNGRCATPKTCKCASKGYCMTKLRRYGKGMARARRAAATEARLMAQYG